MELVSHDVATGRPQQSEDFLLDTHRAIAVELETSPPDLSVLTAAPDVPQIHDITSNEISGAPQNHVQVTPHREYMHYEWDQAVFAAVASIGLFVLCLGLVIWMTQYHNRVWRQSLADHNIFGFNPNKKLDSHFPKGKLNFATRQWQITSVQLARCEKKGDKLKGRTTVAGDIAPI